MLVDWKGKLLKTLKSQSKNTSGIAYGDGCVWMAGNSAAAEGVFQIDMNGRELTHRQIPLGPADNGGGCHGIEDVDGKIYIAALRLRGILRVDAKTWQPEFMIPYAVPRAHGIAHNPADGSVWMVTGTADGLAGLIQYDNTTGRVLSTAAFAKTDCDPHGLAWHDGALYSSDAGIHPGLGGRRQPDARLHLQDRLRRVASGAYADSYQLSAISYQPSASAQFAT